MMPRPGGEAGFATPALTLVLAVLMLALAGVSIDLWRVLGAHQRLVAVTDSAAVAGAGGIDLQALYTAEGGELVLDESAAAQLACDYLTQRLSVGSCPGGDVVISVEAGEITVAMRQRVSLSLTRLLLPLGGGSNRVEIAATATAVPIRLAVP